MNKLLKEANQMLKFWCLDAEPTKSQRVKFESKEGGEKGHQAAIKKEEELKRKHKEVKLVMASPFYTYFEWEVKDADNEEAEIKRDLDILLEQYKKTGKKANKEYLRKEFSARMGYTPSKVDKVFSTYFRDAEPSSKKLPDGITMDLEGYYYYKGKGPYTSIEKALAGGTPNVHVIGDQKENKDNDATENGAIKQFGQNKETEVMPLEKKPILAQDDKFGTVMKEFYEGKLKSGSGKTVTDPQQAKAIAYSESKDEEPVYTFGTKDGQFKKIDEIQKEINDLESEIFGKDKELKSILRETNHPENKVYNPRKQELHKLKGRLDKMKKQLENLKSGKNADGTERKNTQDEKTYQNGEHIKIKWGSRDSDLIDVKVLKDLGDKVTVKAPNGNVVDVPKIYIKDTLDECMEILKLSGFATDAYDPKKYEGTRRHETNIWYLENEVTKWRSRYESAKDQVTAYRKMVSSGQYGKLTTEDLKRAERDLEAARMKLEQSLSMLQRAKGQKDEAPNNQ